NDHFRSGCRKGQDIRGEARLAALSVANSKPAPGATSWTIWSIARPSSGPVTPMQLEISWMTVTGDRSPLATSAAAPPKQLKLFESTPTLTPAPLTPNLERATLERIA